ncbi:hypothetical protein QE152_g9543 [Popillia japonica]|uniref:Uncharacterized protein n=1 Tax=Popillia japonica TaxID=7064 RepID=A0AAW1LYE1_POPJA
MSPPDFRPIPKIEKTHTWTSFSIAGRAFYRLYPSHPTDEQRWYPQWYSIAGRAFYRLYPSHPTDEQRWYPQWYSKASDSGIRSLRSRETILKECKEIFQ